MPGGSYGGQVKAMHTQGAETMHHQHQPLSIGSAFVMVICIVTNAYALLLLTRITIN
jgi:hypothetical protein